MRGIWAMPVQDINDAIRLIKDRRFYVHSYAPASEDEIAALEVALASDLPRSYKAFLRIFGSGGAEDIEIYGIVPGRPNYRAIPNAHWYTEEQKKIGGYPSGLLSIATLGGGHDACLNLNAMKDSECPVVRWDMGSFEAESELDVLAPDFGAYFLKLVQDL